MQVSVTPFNGFNETVSVTASGLPSGLSASPSSFTLQSAPQSITLTADPSMATGTYSFRFEGTSGSLNGSATANVGVGPVQTFTLVSPKVLEVVARFGSTASVPLQTTVCCPPGPDNYQINFSVQGLPASVTANFSPNPIAPGDSTTLTLTAASTGPWIQNTPINVVATPTAGVPPKNLAFDLVVAPQPGSIPNNRSDYLRTDDTPRWIVYDPAHQLIFASEYLLDRVDVVSASTRQIVKGVPVLSPGPMTLTPDGSEVLVGSDAQQITAISTTSLQVVQQWKLPRLSGEDYSVKYLSALSNGTAAVQLVDPNYNWHLAIWNPAVNSMSPVTLPSGLDNFACVVSGAGTKVIVADCFSPDSEAAVYDVTTGTFGTPLTFPDQVVSVTASPDGSRFVIFDDTYGMNLYNDQLQTLASVPAAGYVTGVIFSADGSRVSVVSSDGVPLILVSDANTGALINSAPALGTNPPGEQIFPSPFVETPFAVDSTGLIFGSTDHGIAFDDSTFSVSYILGFNITPSFENVVTPSFGPVNSATIVSFPQEEGFSFLPDVWFGNVRGTGAALGQGGVLTVTTPPSSQAGPVNVKVLQPDGTPIFDPLAFSYGPAPMFVSGDTASPAGGATSDIIGVGLPTDASQIQVTVGGKNASVVSAKPNNIQGMYPPFGYPYPAVDVKITLPSGVGDQDLQVTTPAGTAALPKAIHYVQGVTDYKSADKFQAVLRDRKRNQLYLSAGDHIDVFSLTTQQYLNPISPPALNGQKMFLGLAMTPDGSLLLAANFPDGSVALINPDQPTSATAVQVVPPGTPDSPGPERVATTNTGKAFIEPRTTQAVGCGGPFYELDLSTLQVTTIIGIPDFCIQAEGFPLAASADGSKVLATTSDNAGPQQVAVYDAASNAWSSNFAVAENFGASAAISVDGSVFATGSGLVDGNADLLGYLSWQDVFESGVGSYLPMGKVTDGGSLVYIPNSSFVDIFDVNHGVLLHRISLAEQIQQVTDAMELGPNGQNIYLITNAGLTIVQFVNAPLSIGHLTPPAGSAGTSVAIHGSGFQQTTTVSVNGTPMTASFVDPNTLQATVPGGASGSLQITVTNQFGQSYSLDNGFVVQ